MSEQPLDQVSAFLDGRKTVTAAGTPEAIVASSKRCKWVDITALPANTNVISVGGPDVSAAASTLSGKPLAAGASTRIAVDDAHHVFVDAHTTGEGVAFLIGIA